VVTTYSPPPAPLPPAGPGVPSTGPGPFWREVRPEEEPVQFANIEDDIAKGAGALHDTIAGYLVGVRDELKAQAQEVVGNGHQQSWERLLRIALRGRKGYSPLIRSFLDAQYAKAKSGAAAEIGVAAPLTSAAYTAWAESKSALIQQQQLDLLTQRVRQAALSSTSAAQVGARVDRIFDTFTTAELPKGSELVATLGTQAGREEVAAAEWANVLRVEWSALLDDRTCPVCQALDGRVWETSDPILRTLRPPLHFYCRCLLVLVYQGAKFVPELNPLPGGWELPEMNRAFAEGIGRYVR
jgi:hypothetical protein